MSVASGSPLAVAAPGAAPPHSLEAEQSVLGAILLSERAMYPLVVEEGLKPEDFHRARHRLVYGAMLALYRDGEAIDVLTVAEHLRAEGRLEDAGGQAAIDELTGGVPSAAHVRQYARIVREHALMRRLLATSQDIQSAVLERRAEPRVLVERAERAMLDVAHDDRAKDFRSVEEVLDDELDKLHKLSVEGTALTGTPSGFTDLDEITGGFQPGNLIIIAARPAMGKCVSGQTLVYDPMTGGRRRVDEVVRAHERGEDVWVASVGPDLRVRPSRVSATIRSGRRPLVRVRTRRGRQIDVTGTHPLLTLDGWRAVHALRGGDRIAVPRVLPRSGEPGAVLGVEVMAPDPAGHLARVSAGSPRTHPGQVGSPAASGEPLAVLAPTLDDEALEQLPTSDLRWDEIACIEDAGEDETYDLTVPGDHSFVANDIVVHNSALVTNMAENASIDHGRAVALFSLEMSETELAQRFVASQARIKGEELRKGRVAEHRWPKILEASQRLARAPLFIDDSSDVGMLEVRAKARRLHQQHELGLVIIDYLQLLRADHSIESRVQQVGEMSRALKILARELEVPVIALSQLSRAVESRTDKRPILSDLRESGNIEQDADLVAFLYREEYYDKESDREGIADLIIAKHRNGALGDVELTFAKEYPKFLNYAGDRYER